MRVHLPVAALAAFLLVSSSTADERPLFARLKAIERSVEAQQQRFHVPGVSLVIVKDDRVLYLKGLGHRDVDRELPVTPDTLFAIGSTSKAFTGLSVLMSAEEGKLRLDDSPKKYLPYFKLRDPDADAKITISDLLSHRSGLDRTDLTWYTGALNSRQVLAAAAEAKPTATFGEKFQYQNVMFLAAGEVVAQVQGMPWTTFVERRILKPLGMERTNLSIADMEAEPDHSLGYVWNTAEKRYTRLPMRSATAVAPAGAINSSARDMAQWLRMLLGRGSVDGKRLVSEKNFAEAGVERIKMSPTVGYGYGWFLRKWHGHEVWEHGGNIDGFNAQVAIMPGRNLGMVMLTNVSSSPLPTLAMETVWTELVGKPDSPPTAQPTAQAPAADPGPEVGTYQLVGQPLALQVRLKDGKLTAQPTGQPEIQLLNVGGRRYRAAPPAPEGVVISFRTNPAGKTELVLEQGGVMLVGNRIEAEVPAKPPITPEELMPKVIQALGGETELRKHRTLRLVSEIELENQGLKGTVERLQQSPNLSVETLTLYGAGKKVMSTREWFDGNTGGSESNFSGRDTKTGTALKDAAAASDFYPELNWKTLYKTVEVKRITKVGEEDAYEVVKSPDGGSPVTDFISTKTFLVLRRDIQVGTARYSETLSDYRPVDGVLIPFSVSRTQPGMGSVVVRVREAKFDVKVPPARFRRRG